MRALGDHSRFHRWLRPLAFTPVVTLGLALAGCQGDAPTGLVAPATFTQAPEAGRAAATATHQTLHRMPTLQVWQSTQGQASSATVHSPFDLTNLAGPVVTRATNWDIAVNCATTPAGCWGTGALSPTTFLRDLNESKIIHVLDQYLGENAAGNFPARDLSTTFTFSGAPTADVPGGTASITDIFEIVASAAINTGASGYRNIFRVFLPKGTDMCIAAGDCYSPDNTSTFAFCAFHGSVDIGLSPTNILHVLFSVQPYQAVNGCQLPTQTRVIDATASTLSHEAFESISDPDGDAWFNQQTREEMGDLCFVFDDNDQVGDHSYVIQEEYSNTIHACTNGQ